MELDARAVRRARRSLIAIVGVLVAAGVLAWRYSPLAELANEGHLVAWLETMRHAGWAPIAMLGVYIVAGFIEFPIVLLIAATAVVFEPAWAFAIALGGSLASSLVSYFAGAHVARRTLRTALGTTLERVQQLLKRGGIVTIVVLRSIPFAPFTVVNLAAGSLGVPLRDYVLGTALGLLPGILLMTAFGDRLRALWEQPTLRNVATLAAVLIVWIGVIVALHRFAARVRERAAGATSNS